MNVPSAGGVQSMTVMTLEAFHAFLVTLHPDRIKGPAVRERVIAYQRRAFRVVFEHFHGTMRVAPAKRASIADFMRVGQALKKERNAALRVKLWAEMDRITDSWGGDRVARAVGYSDPDYTDLLANFWSTLKLLDGVDINHSRRNDILAINMPQIRALFAEFGIDMDTGTALAEALRQSTSPRFIGYKAVNCKDGLSRKCWVFSAIGATDVEAGTP